MAPKSAPRQKPGAGGIPANAKNDPAHRKDYSESKRTPAKRPGMSGDRPRSGKSALAGKK
jgi:hypothetical protein